MQTEAERIRPNPRQADEGWGRGHRRSLLSNGVGTAVNQIRRNGYTWGSTSPMLGLTPSPSRDSVDSSGRGGQRGRRCRLPVGVRAGGGEGAMTTMHERAQGIVEAIDPHLQFVSTASTIGSFHE